MCECTAAHCLAPLPLKHNSSTRSAIKTSVTGLGHNSLFVRLRIALYTYVRGGGGGGGRYNIKISAQKVVLRKNIYYYVFALLKIFILISKHTRHVLL